MGSRSEYLMGEAQFLKNIGFRIQYFRKKANLSQEQLAEKSDLDTPNGCPFAFLIRPSRLLPKSQF